MSAPKFDLDAVEAAAKRVVRNDAWYYADDLQDLEVDGDATHIAACSPAVVLAMCARLRWAERLEAACRALGGWDNFVELQAVLSEKP